MEHHKFFKRHVGRTPFPRANEFAMILLFAFGTIYIHAQTPPSETFYKKENSRNRKPTSYVTERESDLMWSKRVWRTIDLREKFNYPLYYPENSTSDRKSLFDVIKEGILSGEIIAFDNPSYDDEFKVKMSKAQVNYLFFSRDNTTKAEEQETFSSSLITSSLSSRDIAQYWVKEDWFFDRQRSVMDVRILGLCPLKNKYDQASGSVVGMMPLFWIYFPQCRNVFAKAEVYNSKNDAQRNTFDDLFTQRMFGSYISKETNIEDRVGTAFTDSQSLGIDALLDAERVKDDIFKVEHDAWNF